MSCAAGALPGDVVPASSFVRSHTSSSFPSGKEADDHGRCTAAAGVAIRLGLLVDPSDGHDRLTAALLVWIRLGRLAISNKESLPDSLFPQVGSTHAHGNTTAWSGLPGSSRWVLLVPWLNVRAVTISDCDALANSNSQNARV